VPCRMDDLLQLAARRGWYHTLELPGLTTSGLFDLRPYVRHYGLPASLEGKRVLEIGTWDGFWAFECERRGAEEVVALDLDDEGDLDWPPRRRPSAFPEAPRGAGFHLAAKLLDSRVRRVVRSIYDAAPEELGTFDLVLCGSVLIHLRDQLLALERIFALTAPGGLFVSAEEYPRSLEAIPFPVARYRADRDAAVVFWQPSRRAWRRMLGYAGFASVREVARFDMRSSEGWKVRHAVNHAQRS